MNNLYRVALLLVVSLMIHMPARASERSVVRLGVIDESFYEVVGNVVAQTLEKRGYHVIMTTGSHTAVYQAVGRGDIDLCVGFWLPDGHATQWKALGGNVAEVVTVYEGARFFWGVPSYVPETDVSTIADLGTPTVAARMDHTIHGLSPDTTITFQSIAAVDKYGLRAAGYQVVPGSFAALTSSLRQAVAERRWVVVPTWTPYWFVRQYGLRPLGDPQNLLGGANRVVLAAHNPPGARLLNAADISAVKDLHMSLNDVIDMDVAVNAGGVSPQRAAQTWLAGRANH